MEKQQITFDEVMKMGAPDFIQYAVPVMIILVLAEWGFSTYQKRRLYDKRDLFAASLIGVGNLLVSAFVKTSLFITVLFIINLVPWFIPPTWWSYILCLIVIDFCRYWGHRIAHENRFWWATHVTHHNSKKYNWSVSFRLSWTQHIKFVFFLPVAFMGFHPVVFFICHQVEVLYQFWIHTEYIRKLPRPIEYVFTTPSHHRVHHATNPKYIDKNYGSTLIIWDRIFGTFQAEEEQPVYGITKPINTYNPILLVFHEWISIVKDLSHAANLKEAGKFLFGRPGSNELRKNES